MFLSTQQRLKELLHSLGFMVLVTTIVAGPLVGCGGGGGGSGVIPSGSTGSSTPAGSSVNDNNDSVAPATGSFTLGWTAPTTRSDGTPLSLSDIDGFRIYYGTSRGDYPNSVNVKDGSAQSAVVIHVPAGNYYVVMTTYDVSGLESGYSSPISKAAL